MVVAKNLRVFARRPTLRQPYRQVVPDHERICVFQQSGPNDRGSFPESSVPVSPTLALVGFVGLCLLAGIVGGSITANAVHHWYQTLHAPPGTPPNWVFAPVWTTLYVMIGVAGWLVWKRLGAAPALRLWGWQLAASALWAPAFFGLHSPAVAMGVMAILLVLIALTIRSFLRVQPIAAILMAPYGAWCVYAAYLNAGFLVLNHT
jgi:tryptophan-rich sensory protein